jgi:CRP-like cAMP-binding protein
MKTILDTGSHELKTKLEELGNRVSLQPDETLFRHGEMATVLPVIESGRVKIVRYPTVGKEIIVNIFGAGEIFAIPPVIDATPYPASAVAIEESAVLLIQRPDFLRLLGASPEFSRFIMMRMSGLLQETTRAIEIHATASPEKKIASVLIWLADKEHGSNPVTISLRRQDIAEIAGLATETTIRTIRSFAEAGALTITRGKIIMDNIAMLERACESG